MDAARRSQLQDWLHSLGIQPASIDIDWEELDQALTHPSISGDRNYEKLEFFGDAALRLAAAEYLMAELPAATVGDLSALRSRLVSDRTLADIAHQYRLGELLHLSAAARKDTAAQQSQLADGLEAVLGVLYRTTHNTDLVHQWLDRHFRQLAAQMLADPAMGNYKNALQELTQARFQVLPDYQTQELNQIHGDSERFGSEVWVQGRAWGTGKGRSIKLAEQNAARAAYQALIANPLP
ncbi:MAG: ribonuclease III [Cyanobacteria bacterium P01_D01_bin.128]